MQYLVSYCLYYVIKDKTTENSAKRGAYLNVYFLTFLNPVSSTNIEHMYPIFCAHLIIFLGVLNLDIITSTPPLECLHCLFVCNL